MQIFHSGGLGGQIYKIPLEDGEFLVKCEFYEQSLNEFVAHSLISAIGLPAPNVALVRIGREDLEELNLTDAPFDVFGAVNFIPGLKRVTDKDVFESNNQSRILSYLELLVLDKILGNEDDTVEIYEDSVGRMFLLDLGESLFSATFLISFLKNDAYSDLLLLSLCNINAERIDHCIKEAIISCRKRMDLNNCFDEELLLDSVSNIIIRLANLDIRKMQSCLRGLKKAYGERVCEVYRQYLKRLRNACRIIAKYSGSITEEHF